MDKATLRLPYVLFTKRRGCRRCRNANSCRRFARAFPRCKIYFFAARFNDFHIFPLLLGAFVKNTLKRAAIAEAIKVDVRYALGQNHPFQIVAKTEQSLLYLASVRQNAGFEFAALAESRLFYQSNSVWNNDIFYVPPRKRVFADCGNGAVVWNFAFCSARQKRFGFFLCQAFTRPAVNFVSALYRDCFEVVAARKNVIPDFSVLREWLFLSFSQPENAL